MNILTTGEERVNLVWNSYGIPKKFINARFDNYNPQNTEQQKAMQKCMAFTKRDISQITKGDGMFFHGPVGTGKTHLAVATMYKIIANNIELFGYKCRNSDLMLLDEAELAQAFTGMHIGFINVTDLLTTLQDSYSGNERAKIKASNMLHQTKTDDFIILDDIGAMKPTEWVETQLYNLVDIRYRMERPMIFTSNCAMSDLEKQLGKRVVSRIFEVTDGIHITGPDYRKRKLA